MMQTLLVVAIAGSGLVACSQPAAPPTPPQPPKEPTSDSSVVWQRSRECAVSASEMMRQPEWKGSGTSLVSWQSHYGHKWNACYVKATIADLSKQEAGAPRLPRITYSLEDVFEHRTLAECTDQGVATEYASLFCTITTGSASLDSMGDCAACKQFVTERLAN